MIRLHLRMHTVKAPGTEKSTTFLPFQLSVERVVACDHSNKSYSTGTGRKQTHGYHMLTVT
jgi:hypothetical protein